MKRLIVSTVLFKRQPHSCKSREVFWEFLFGTDERTDACSTEFSILLRWVHQQQSFRISKRLVLFENRWDSWKACFLSFGRSPCQESAGCSVALGGGDWRWSSLDNKHGEYVYVYGDYSNWWISSCKCYTCTVSPPCAWECVTGGSRMLWRLWNIACTCKVARPCGFEHAFADRWSSRMLWDSTGTCGVFHLCAWGCVFVNWLAGRSRGSRYYTCTAFRQCECGCESSGALQAQRP